MKFKIMLLLPLIAFLVACSTNVIPLNPADKFYNANLHVHQPYEIKPTFFLLGFRLPATTYKAYMRDKNGIFFSSATPLIATDELVGTVFRNGGIYYQQYPTRNVFLYIVDTNGYAGPSVIGQPLSGLSYNITGVR